MSLTITYHRNEHCKGVPAGLRIFLKGCRLLMQALNTVFGFRRVGEL
jgi:hypothetical protein